MRLLACSVYDRGVGAYMAPFFCRSKGEAVRSFADACSDPAVPFGRNAKDFHLSHVGYFDDGDAELTPCVPETLITALECVHAIEEKVKRP